MTNSITRTALALVLSALASFATTAGAAEDARLMDALRRDLGTGSKRAVVEKTLALTPAEAAKFWPLYERYERAAALIASRENQAMLDYIQSGSAMSDANAKRIALELSRASADGERLRDQQLKRLLSVLPAKKAVRYMQLETRLQTLQRYDMAQQLPLVQ